MFSGQQLQWPLSVQQVVLHTSLIMALTADKKQLLQDTDCTTDATRKTRNLLNLRVISLCILFGKLTFPTPHLKIVTFNIIQYVAKVTGHSMFNMLPLASTDVCHILYIRLIQSLRIASATLPGPRVSLLWFINDNHFVTYFVQSFSPNVLVCSVVLSTLMQRCLK